MYISKRNNFFLKIKKLGAAILLAPLSLITVHCKEDTGTEALPLEVCMRTDTIAWFEQMINYGMEDRIAPDQFTYTWSDAVFLKALMMLHENPSLSDDKYLRYIKEAVDLTLDKVNGGTPNDLAPGVGVVYLYRKTGEAIYLEKAERIYTDYRRITRAANGGVSHTYGEVQLWNDTLYMIGLYLMEMYLATGDTAYLDEYINQVKWHAEHLYDENEGLWYHAWDEDRIDKSSVGSLPNWPDPLTGRSKEFWGRGNGWIFMSLADALAIIPAAYPGKSDLEDIFRSMANTLVLLQDEPSGHWYQLPIYPQETGNFLESSCTSMFGYAMARGVRLGLLEESIYRPILQNALRGLCTYSVEQVNEQYVWPVNICVGTSVGDKNYYYNRSIVSGVGFAFGSFVSFAHEMQLLSRE